MTPHSSSAPVASKAQAPLPALWFSLQGWRRRLVYVTVFEGLAIACTSFGLASMSGDGMAHAGVMGVASSLIALLWNLIFNSLFERWERGQTVKGRSPARRLAHMLGFEGGLLLIFVPLFAWWFEVDLWTSFLMDLGLLLFFMAYTYAYGWLFDRLFGLPASAC